MSQVRVALVCADESSRMAAAAAFDEAPAGWEVSLHRAPPESADVLVAVGCRLTDAVPFDPARPEAVIEEVERRIAGRHHRQIAVVGASGGSGVSTVALHLAAESSRRTCVVGSRETSGLLHRLALEPTVTGPVPVAGGFHVMTAPGPELSETASRLAVRFESVLVDAERSTVQAVVAGSHACVLVLAPTMPAAGAAAELLARFPDVRWAVVTNRLGPGGETSTAELTRVLGRRICLELPCSRGLRDAEGEGALVSTWSPWRQKIKRLALALGLR